MDSIDDLRALAFRLQQVRNSIQSYQPRVPAPPILTAPASNATSQLDGKFPAKDSLSGLRTLREEVNQGGPHISTNALYLIAVWQELAYSHHPIALYRTFFHQNRSQEHIPHGRKLSNRPVKVDVVSENGARWIRVNTIKNSRLVMEFHELDLYLTSSSEEEGDRDGGTRHGSLTHPPASQELENSVLRMARELLAAAAANPLPTSGHVPQVTLRLTRLNPTLVGGSGVEADPRIARTIGILRDMGIDVQLGERPKVLPDDSHEMQQIELEPTSNINLDLSVLIALVSEITHASLPRSPGEAQTRFRHWKLHTQDTSTERTLKTASNHNNNETYKAAHATERRPTEENEQTRALSRQTTQEMRRGLLQDMHDQLSSLGQSVSSSAQPFVRDVFPESPAICTPDMSNIKFWTTEAARQRCLQIVAKIGGLREQRRAHALLGVHHCSGSSETEDRWDRAAAEAAYWSDSRYPLGHLPLIPVHILPSCHAVASDSKDSNIRTKWIPAPPSPSAFFLALSTTCAKLLADNTDPQACTQRPIVPKEDLPNNCLVGIPPAPTLITSKLTAHTVESMYAGAFRGWTTLTANCTSVRALLREIDKRESLDTLQHDGGGATATSPAVIWLVEPRSLAEAMRVDDGE